MAAFANFVLRAAAEQDDPANTPALKAPYGQTSNLVDPPTRQGATIAAMVLFIVTATPCVVARIYTRIYVHSSLWWDDWTNIIGLVGLYGFAGIIFESLKYGNGTDIWNVSKADNDRFEELFQNIEVVARISIFFVKASILLLYLRYFCPPMTQKNGVWWASWAAIIFNLLYCIALVLAVLLQCAGKPHESGQTCFNGYAVLVTASIINVVTDLVMLFIPMAAVWKLKMPRRKKLGISVVFAVGSLAVASSLARLGYQIPEASDTNRTVLLTNVSILSLAEHTIGVIVGCIPIFPSLWRHLFGKSSGSRNSESHMSKLKAAVLSSPRNRSSSSRPRRVYNDTTLLATENHDFEELHNDSEHGNFTVIEADSNVHGRAIEMPERLRKDQHNTAIVSQSVKVTSLPNFERD